MGLGRFLVVRSGLGFLQRLELPDLMLEDSSGVGEVVEVERDEGRVEEVEKGVGFGEVEMDKERVEEVEKGVFFNLFLLQILQMLFCAVFPEFDIHRDGMMFQIQNSCYYFEVNFVMILVSKYHQSETHYYFGANVADQYYEMLILANESGHHNVTSCLKNRDNIRPRGHRRDNRSVASCSYLPFLSI